VGELLAQRRATAEARLARLRARLIAGEDLAGSSACVYMTGSFGRGEAGGFSDLDLFVIAPGTSLRGESAPASDSTLKERLIDATRAEGFPPFTDGGKYLEPHSIDALVGALGSRTDDADNTFTARLLLLLESRVLVGDIAYRNAIAKVIDAYWRDFDRHRDDFLPAFLINDILRLWRTFCVNYEAGRRDEPVDERVKAHVKRYKLKHSRLMTCYSAVAYLMNVHGREGVVRPDHARGMVKLTPTARIEAVGNERGGAVAAACVALLDRYERFLRHSNADKPTLIEKFADDVYRRERFAESDAFRDAVLAVLHEIGGDPRFRNVLIV